MTKVSNEKIKKQINLHIEAIQKLAKTLKKMPFTQTEDRLIEIENKLAAANRNLFHFRRLNSHLKKRRIVLLNIIIDLEAKNKQLKQENEKLKLELNKK